MFSTSKQANNRESQIFLLKIFVNISKTPILKYIQKTYLEIIMTVKNC